MTQIYLLSYEVEPTEARSQQENDAGAFVNCFIAQQDVDQARRLARQVIEDAGWVIVECDAEKLISRDDVSSDAVEYFDQALIDQEVFVFHTWPADAPDADELD
ncbi:MAG: hypothetical protein AAF586_07235 [Planctomycetota bacterium]